jgi:hypothetical protein
LVAPELALGLAALNDFMGNGIEKVIPKILEDAAMPAGPLRGLTRGNGLARYA